jgi:Ca2+-binding EF-hand superfamily protein
MKTSCIAAALLAATGAFAADAMFAAMDRDRDGRISAREHTIAARTMFVAMDADKDGRVTSAEMTAAQSNVGNRQADGLSSAQKIQVVDRNRDGVLTAGEHVAGSRTMFRRMDTNNDGHLSAAEYSAGQAAMLARK